MHPYFYLIDKTACRDIHQRMALDALSYLKCRHAARWRRLLLKHYEDFLDGASAPDTRFKDFRNHVLHVERDGWGGAVITAKEWYDNTLEAVQRLAWRNLAFSAGVLSHYVTDPLHPFHTDQSQQQIDIHRAFDRSLKKAYRRIRPISEVVQDHGTIELPDGERWLDAALLEGATIAHESYQLLVDRYDFHSSMHTPIAAMDDECTKAMSGLIRYATRLFAAVLSRALDEYDLLPPMIHLHRETIIAIAKSPVRWSRERVCDVQTHWEIVRTHDEWERNGRVRNQVTEEDRAIRDLLHKQSRGQADATERFGDCSTGSSTLQTDQPSSLESSRPTIGSELQQSLHRGGADGRNAKTGSSKRERRKRQEAARLRLVRDGDSHMPPQSETRIDPAPRTTTDMELAQRTIGKNSIGQNSIGQRKRAA